MKRFYLWYTLWLVTVLAAGYYAFEWYRHIEKIGWEEVAKRVQTGND